jgi:hypothetical protein
MRSNERNPKDRNPGRLRSSFEEGPMQKDVHFYLTYLLARKVGVPDPDAEKIAWADQYTDDLTKPNLYEIQTQSDILGNWAERQIQLSVLIPFHFLPGDDPQHPWMTTRNSLRAQSLVEAAREDLFQLGIALHVFQDTFSHETFSGWKEDLNACFPWYQVEAAIPNVGHAELRAIPDVVNYVWTDPRSGKQVDNKERTLAAAEATFDYLSKFFNPGLNPSVWQTLEPKLKRLNKLGYDKRIDEFCALSGRSDIDYKEVNARLEGDDKADFIKAASKHLSETMKLLQNLPWVGP